MSTDKYTKPTDICINKSMESEDFILIFQQCIMLMIQYNSITFSILSFISKKNDQNVGLNNALGNWYMFNF